MVQETWLAVVQGIDGFQGRSSLRTWVYRILVNTAKGRGQRERRVLPLSSLRPSDPDAGGPTADPDRFRDPGEPYPGHWREFPAPWPVPEQPGQPEARALDGEVRGVLLAALEQLPQRQRQVITLRDVEGYDAPEVREILQVTAANQRMLLHRGRAFVRARLEQHYAGVSEELPS
ncbi:MAG: sigma-70 family RNA polymerase sigma factor [Thermocrispum sp.]